MSTERRAEPLDSLNAGSMSRRQAAQLLKLAREETCEVVTEAIDWAYATMPDRAIVQRLKARSLLCTGQFDAADALIAQALLIHPTDPVLSTMRAERLLARGRADGAAREIELVLTRHPKRPSALALGARVAAAHGDHARAVALLERAVDVRPADAQIRMQLIEALLSAGEPVQAAHQLAYLADPPVLLEARALRAQGRAVDALACLQAEWSQAPEGEHADDVAAAMVELLEDVGALDELEQLTEQLGASHPQALARAAQAWLMLGRFDEAITLGAQLLKRRAFVPSGRGILLVGATMKGNFGIARRVLHQLVTSELTIDRVSLAELWRRGIIGKLICTHTALTRTESAGHQSVLASLAQTAIEILREQLVEADANGNPTEAAELMQLIRQCTLHPKAERVRAPVWRAVSPMVDDRSQRDADRSQREPVAARRAA